MTRKRKKVAKESEGRSLRYRLVMGAMVIIGVLTVLFETGCEDDNRPNDNYSSYNYDGYVNVFVDNQGPYDTVIIIGNAPEETLEPGQGTYVSRYLVGNQALWLSVEFLDQNGYAFARSDVEEFYQSNGQQNLVIYGPGDVRAYR